MQEKNILNEFLSSILYNLKQTGLWILDPCLSTTNSYTHHAMIRWARAQIVKGAPGTKWRKSSKDSTEDRL